MSAKYWFTNCVLVQLEVEMRGGEVAYTQTLEQFHEQASSQTHPC